MLRNVTPYILKSH